MNNKNKQWKHQQEQEQIHQLLAKILLREQERKDIHRGTNKHERMLKNAANQVLIF